MKSVCLVVQMIYDADVRVRRKAEALVSAGYWVDVLALRAVGGKKQYDLNGVHVRTVSLGKKRGSLARYIFEYVVFFLWVLFCVSQQMRRRRYAAIDVNTLPDFLIFAPVIARWMGAKLILDMHEVTPEFYMSKYQIAENSFIIRGIKYVERVSMAFADYVITINKPIEDLLASRGLDRAQSTIIMNAADEARFGVRVPATAKVNNKFVMMYHGTLTKIYGLDIAVEAFSIAKSDMPGAELWILGGGTEKEALQMQVEARGLASHVRLIGVVPSSEIPSWLSQCDVGVLPIRGDVFLNLAFPNKLPEFIVMEKAVIISRLNAIRSYFSEQALAYVAPNDPADLARQMVRLYRDPELRAQIATQAKKENAAICWEIMKQRYLRLMGEVCGAPGAGVDPEGSKECGVMANRR